MFWLHFLFMLHLYRAFICTQIPLHMAGGGGGSPQRPTMCSFHLDEATVAILSRTCTTHQLTGEAETE